ncbi:ATP-binding cassette domain-containing protein [Myxosarcina sp. GI1]|uniref:ABC transporter ATP-binding protein n=1 Tax=Myxosarcina sp. GI1 TaxID=1541065 RepID=UPI00055C49D2|nr:ATP-binding cassette domain-containing protein [Myxosarcina sp. GI1]
MSDRTYNSILLLERVDLKASIGSALLLQDISFAVQPGEKIAVAGASGAGKTSLLRLLNRLNSPNLGKIYFEDVSLAKISPVRLRQQIVLVPQEPKLLGMTVRETLVYPLKLQKLPPATIQQRLDLWQHRLRLPEAWLDKNELQLSQGQRQLVTIARALMMQPKILLLDEPTSALDLGLADRLLNVLNELNRSDRTTIFMVNHQLELMHNFCDRILHLSTGRLTTDITASADAWSKLQQQILQTQRQNTEEWS